MGAVQTGVGEITMKLGAMAAIALWLLNIAIGSGTNCAGKAAYVGTGFQKRYRAQGNPGG